MMKNKKDLFLSPKIIIKYKSEKIMGYARTQAGAKRRVVMKRTLNQAGIKFSPDTPNDNLKKLWRKFIKKPVPNINRYKNDPKDKKYKKDLDEITQKAKAHRKEILKMIQVPGIASKLGRGEKVSYQEVINKANKEIQRLEGKQKELSKKEKAIRKFLR